MWTRVCSLPGEPRTLAGLHEAWGEESRTLGSLFQSELLCSSIDRWTFAPSFSEERFTHTKTDKQYNEGSVRGSARLTNPVRGPVTETVCSMPRLERGTLMFVVIITDSEMAPGL